MPIDPKDAQVFVTKEFIRTTVIPDQTVYSETRGKFEYAQWVESLLWLVMGVDIGYFDPTNALIATRAFARRRESALPLTWPQWFDVRQNIKLFGRARVTPKWWSAHRRGKMTSDERLERDQPTILAIFQAALILSRGLREVCCLSLQKALQDENLLGATFRDVQGAEVLLFLSGSVAVQPENPDCQLAGFMQLINLLAAFEAVFPPQYEKAIGDDPRQTVAKMIGNLLAWRLNLRNERVVENLSNIERAFWKLCEDELSEQVRSWSSSTSRDNLRQLFVNWRDRSNPDELLLFGGPLPGAGTPRPTQSFERTFEVE